MNELTSLDRLPPHSLPAEQGVLGCILLSPSESLDACATLPPAAFYDLRHRDLLQTLRDMHDARQPLDLITVQQRLKDAGQLEAVGGISYLSGLLDAVPSAANLGYYLGILREKFTLRRMLSVATETISRIHENAAPVEDLVAGFERDVLSVREDSADDSEADVRGCLTEIISEMQEAASGKPTPRLWTGLHALDQSSEGLREGELFVIAGRPGTGKTSLAMQVAEHVAVGCGKPVGVFSLEMSRKELLGRMATSLARVDARRAERGQFNAQEASRLTAAMGRLSRAHLLIWDKPGLTVAQIAARARRWKQRHGIELLVLDYLGLIRDSGRQRSRYEAVSDITREVKALAKELRVPVILLCQLNRASETDNRAPRLSDLRDSGSIEQDADLVWLLHHEDGSVIVATAKARRGPRGTTRLNFIGSYTRFEDQTNAPDTGSLEGHP
ncbi:MAG: replicative DNA helicase [Verrucomicrobia bacterium]|nr:replicative DNA helicase [Verrucomicrobiota bacterium]